MRQRQACLQRTHEQIQDKSHVLTDEGYNDLDKTYKATVYYCWLNLPEFADKEKSRNHPVPKRNTKKLLQHEALFQDSENPKSLIIFKFVTPQLFPSYKLQGNHQIQTIYDNYYTASSTLSRQSIRITSFIKITMKVLRIRNVFINEYK